MRTYAKINCRSLQYPVLQTLLPEPIGAAQGYDDFLPPVPVPVSRADANGETGGAFFCLFLSAFGFFFSRLLLI
jgi:hypothetical protein